MRSTSSMQLATVEQQQNNEKIKNNNIYLYIVRSYITYRIDTIRIKSSFVQIVLVCFSSLFEKELRTPVLIQCKNHE